MLAIFSLYCRALCPHALFACCFRTLYFRMPFPNNIVTRYVRALFSHAIFVCYVRMLFSHVFVRTLSSHTIYARYFPLDIFARSLRTLFSHDISARYFRTLVHDFRSLSSHAIFACYFCTLAISARYFRMPFPNFIFARYFHTLFAHVIFGRCFRTLCSHAFSARHFRMLLESCLSPSGTYFGGHFGVILEPVLGSPGGSQKTLKIDPKMDRIFGAKTLVFHLFLKQKCEKIRTRSAAFPPPDPPI